MKKCKVCKQPFEPRFNTTQVVCSLECAKLQGRQQADKKKTLERKEQRKKDKKWLDDNKNRKKLCAEAQQAVNGFIRERDRGKPCISCRGDLCKPDSKHEAGHYRSVGSCIELRYNVFNINLQGVKCNKELSGNVVEYRKGLIAKLGEDRVNWLEGKHELKKYSREDLERIKKIFRKRTRIYQKEGFKRKRL